MKKRIVSSIMCLAMLLSLLPVTAFAAPPESNDNAAITVGYAKEKTGVEDSAKAAGVSDTRAAAMQDQVTDGTTQNNILWFLMTGLKAGNNYSLSMENEDGENILKPAAVNAGNDTGKFSIGTSDTGNYFLYVSLDLTWQIGTVTAGDYTVKVLDGTNTVVETTVTFADAAGDWTVTQAPEIAKAGFAWDYAAARTGFNADIGAVRGTAGTNDDADDQSMWAVFNHMKSDQTYTFTVTKDTDVVFTDTFEADKVNPAYIWSPLDGGNKDCPAMSAGTYTINLYEGGDATGTAIASKDVTVSAYTAPTTAPTVSADKKTITLTLDPKLRGEYKAELLKDNVAVAGKVVEKFLSGAEDITFTNDTAFADGAYTIKVSTRNTTPTVMFTTPAVTISNIPTLTVVAPEDSDALWKKTAADIQTITVNGTTVTGTSKYIDTAWTDFSSVEAEQTGNYLALELTASNGGNVWISNSAGTDWKMVDKTDNTVVLLLKNYGDTLKAVISAEKPTTANPANVVNINIAGVTRQPADATTLVVEPATGIIADLGDKAVADLQNGVKVTRNSATAFELEGTAKYVIDWNEFSSVPAEKSGHYIALKLTAGDGATIKIKDGPTLTADGIVVKRLENFTGTDKTMTFEVSKTGATTKEYTVDFSSVVPAKATMTATKATGTELSKPLSQLGTYTVAAPDANNVIKITGDVNYVANWTDFSSDAVQKNGHYIALTLTSNPAVGMKITSPSENDKVKNVASGDTLITRLENFSTGKSTVTVGEGANAATYTIDFSKVRQVPLAITGVSVTDGTTANDAVVASYANGTITLSGVLDFASADKTLTLSVTTSPVTSGTYTVKVTKEGMTLDKTELNIAGTKVALASTLEAKANDVVPKTGSTTTGSDIPATDNDKTTAAATFVTRLADTPTVDPTVVAAAAAKAANAETATKDSSLSAAKTVVDALPDTAPAASSNLTTILNAAAETGTTTTERDKVTQVVQVSMELKVSDVTLDAGKNATSIELEIRPVAKTIVTTDPSSMTILASNGSNADTANAVVTKTTYPTINEPTSVTIGVPDVVTSGCVVEHLKNDHSYYYPATVSGVSGSKTLTFTSQHGFSPFVLHLSNPCEAKVGNELYKTLEEAIAAVPNNGEITLLKNIDRNITVSGSESKVFNIAKNTFALDTTKVTGATVTDTGSGYNVIYTYVAPEDKPSSGGGGSVSNKVSIGSTTNGKITANNYNPKEGDTVTITATPNDGYVTGTVTVKDAKGNDVTVTKTGDNTFTFTMPKDKVTVNATFVKEDTSTFTDVNDGDYYADAVKWAVEKGITNGLTATTFGPNNSCTRGQMVTFLWRAAGSPAATGTNSFTDVASGEYYYNAVLWAVEKGITNGTSATTFSPNATVNRGQTVTFLYRYAESPAATGDISFTDVAADAFYADAVKWAVAEEITNGTSATTFAPNSNCTRGQIVTFLYRQMAE